jgi:hypothetical protein
MYVQLSANSPRKLAGTIYGRRWVTANGFVPASSCAFSLIWTLCSPDRDPVSGRKTLWLVTGPDPWDEYNVLVEPIRRDRTPMVSGGLTEPAVWNEVVSGFRQVREAGKLVT